MRLVIIILAWCRTAINRGRREVVNRWWCLIINRRWRVIIDGWRGWRIDDALLVANRSTAICPATAMLVLVVIVVTVVATPPVVRVGD